MLIPVNLYRSGYIRRYTPDVVNVPQKELQVEEEIASANSVAEMNKAMLHGLMKYVAKKVKQP